MKMRIVFFSCLVMTYLMLSAGGAARCFAEQEGIEAVAVCGTASLEGEPEKAVEQAVADGKRQAVLKALGRLISPDAVGHFANITNDIDSYCAGVKVLHQRERNGKSEVFCQVGVDFAKLSAGVRENIKKQQQRYNGQQIFTLVRTTGFSDAAEQHRQQVKLLRIYNQTMQNSGFDVGGGDFVTDFAMQHEHLPYASYSAAAMSAVQERVEIGIAVIGEVTVSSLTEDSSGSTAIAAVKLKIIDCINNRPVGLINENYQMRRQSLSEAEQFAVNKAAHSSVRQIEMLLLNYWQS